eukprot:3042091-Pyramimonas_sp.AAC.1
MVLAFPPSGTTPPTRKRNLDRAILRPAPSAIGTAAAPPARSARRTPRTIPPRRAALERTTRPRPLAP